MHLLYDSTPAEFRSAYGIVESVERLSAATKRSVFSALGETTAVGKVSEKVVRLQRVIPMVGNSFKPFFIGHFEVRGEVTVLIEKFTMLPLVKVFMSFWFGLCGLFAGAVVGSHLWPSLVQAGESSTSLQLGYWNFVYAILVVALSIGIWRRRPWAWWV
jgi:hypothetical protein